MAQARNLAFAYSVRTAATSVLYAAASDEVELEGISGELIVPIATRWPPHHRKAEDPSFGAALWEFSERVANDALRKRSHR